MTDELATVAVAQSSLKNSAFLQNPAVAGYDLPAGFAPRSIAEWAERPIEMLSRWAGILAFTGTVAGILYWMI